MITTEETIDQPARSKLTRFMAAAVVAGIVLATLPTLMTCGGVTLLEIGATARQTHGIHLAVLGMGSAIAFGVCGVLLYSIGTYRVTDEPRSSGIRMAIRETVWALVPIAILIGAAMPAVHALVAADFPERSQTLPGANHRCAIGPANRS